MRALLTPMSTAFLVAATVVSACTAPGDQTTGTTSAPPAVAASTFTQQPTISQTQSPSPSPSLSPQQRLELAVKLQQDYLARDIVRLALPDGVGRTLDPSESVYDPAPGGEVDLFLAARNAGELTLPAPFSGNVVQAKDLNKYANYVSIEQGKWTVNVIVTSESALLVKRGDRASLGTPIVNIRYAPESSAQSAFETTAKGPKGLVALFAFRDNSRFGQATLSTGVLTDDSGALLTIPVVGGSVAAVIPSLLPAPAASTSPTPPTATPPPESFPPGTVTFSVRGRVVAGSGQPLKGIWVLAQCANFVSKFQAATDFRGNYVIRVPATAGACRFDFAFPLAPNPGYADNYWTKNGTPADRSQGDSIVIDRDTAGIDMQFLSMSCPSSSVAVTCQ